MCCRSRRGLGIYLAAGLDRHEAARELHKKQRKEDGFRSEKER